MAGIGCSKKKTDLQQDRSMLKFGMFVSSILDPSASHCSSWSSNTEGIHKNIMKSNKGKAKVDYPSKAKTTKLKKNLKTLGSGPSVSGFKRNLQNPTPRLKIDLTSKNKEKISIPPISDTKGLLCPGPSHLKLKSSKGPCTKHFNFHKCYHCGLKDHVASKCPNATKAEKLAKVKIIPKDEKSAKGKKVIKSDSSAKTAATDTESSVKAVTDSTPPTDSSGPNTKWVPKET